MGDADMYMVYADESGTTAGPFYTIGAVALPADQTDGFSSWVDDLARKHGVSDEPKWKKVKKGHGLINMTLDLVRAVADGHLRFHAIVVDKREYREWKADRETAFYKTYSLLLTHLGKECGTDLEVLIDERCDSYDKREEVVQKITTARLAKAARGTRVTSVEKVCSKATRGVQVADLLAGLVNHGHVLSVDPDFGHAGKRVLVERAASMLGWDGLHYDTMPTDGLNVWHFPTETRGPTRAVKSTGGVPFLRADEHYLLEGAAAC